jgi:hypothetical protein
MKVSSSMTSLMEEGYIYTLMEVNTTGDGKQIKRMGKPYFTIQTDI